MAASFFKSTESPLPMGRDLSNVSANASSYPKTGKEDTSFLSQASSKVPPIAQSVPKTGSEDTSFLGKASSTVPPIAQSAAKGRS